MNTCFLLVKQAVALVSFPAWVQRAASVLCLGGNVISLETAAWRHGESSSFICGRRVLCWDGPRVMLLVLWCYGVYKVFDSSDGLSQPVLRRESSGPSGSSLRALESELREQEEGERGRGSSFKLSDFGHRPQAAGQIRVSVWGRAPPMSMVSDDFGLRYLIFHSFCERYTQAFISVVTYIMMPKFNGHPHHSWLMMPASFRD